MKKFALSGIDKYLCKISNLNTKKKFFKASILEKIFGLTLTHESFRLFNNCFQKYNFLNLNSKFFQISSKFSPEIGDVISVALKFFSQNR